MRCQFLKCMTVFLGISIYHAQTNLLSFQMLCSLDKKAGFKIANQTCSYDCITFEQHKI